MKMKKLLVLFMVMVLTLTVFTACDKDEEESEKEGEKKVLKVGMEIGYPPFEYYDDDGSTPIGVDVELSKAIAKELGMEVELVNTEWDGIFAGLQKGDYDCVISAVTVTPERLIDFEFSIPYIENWQSIVVLADGEFKPAKVEDLVGHKICYQEETTSDLYIEEFFKDAEEKPETFEYAEVLNCFNELKLGRVDAVVCDSTVASSYVGDGTYELAWNQENEEGATPEEFGVCMNKGDDELIADINKALMKLKKDGKLDEILDKYF